MIHPQVILKDLAAGKCVYHQTTYKRPVYYYEDDGLYRMILHEVIQAGLSVQFFEEFSEMIEKLKSASKLMIMPPLTSKGPDGVLREIFTGHKVRVLHKEYQGFGSLILDESPKSFNIGITVSHGRTLIEYDNTMWQVYLDKRKHLGKLERKVSEVRSGLLRVIGDMDAKATVTHIG